QATPPRVIRLPRARRGGLDQVGTRNAERGTNDGGGGAGCFGWCRELSAGGTGSGGGPRRDRSLGRRDQSRRRGGVSPREADGQHRFRSVVAEADDPRVGVAGTRRAAGATRYSLRRPTTVSAVPTQNRNIHFTSSAFCEASSEASSRRSA